MGLTSLQSLFTPYLDLIQLDVTTRGSRSGRMTLRRAYADQWVERDMSLDTLRALKPALNRTKVCHLQGWGEPLLNPDFFEMVRIASQCGCLTATAISDGSLIDETMARELVHSGLTSLTFSISALTDRENLERRGVNLATVFQALEEIKRHQPRYGDKTPAISLLYSMHRGDLDSLEKFPSIFQGLGVNALIVNTLSFTPGLEGEEETLVPGNQEEFEGLNEIIRETAAKADKREMQLHAFVVHGGKSPPRCIEKLDRGCFVKYDGTVAPCIFSQPPLEGSPTYRFQGMDMPFPRIRFGNTREAAFKHIWNAPAYKEFRRQYKQTGVPDFCQGCWRPYIVAIKPGRGDS